MTYEIEVIDVEPTHTVVLPRRVRSGVLPEVIGPAIDRATSLVTAARLTPGGPPFVRYLSFGEEVEVEVGFPTDRPQSVPALRSSMLPGGRAASTWHVGPYSGLPAAFEAVTRWIEEHGAVPGRPWEWYWTPHDEDPPRTQVVWPVDPE